MPQPRCRPASGCCEVVSTSCCGSFASLTPPEPRRSQQLQGGSRGRESCQSLGGPPLPPPPPPPLSGALDSADCSQPLIMPLAYITGFHMQSPTRNAHPQAADCVRGCAGAPKRRRAAGGSGEGRRSRHLAAPRSRRIPGAFESGRGPAGRRQLSILTKELQCVGACKPRRPGRLRGEPPRLRAGPDS